ncbi:little elongation complex subunit 1, partial [Silurus meridionalis]
LFSNCSIFQLPVLESGGVICQEGKKRKSVWLILNTWLKQTQTEETKFRNVSVAAIFRLLGRLGHNGLKENVAASVEDLVKSITEFRGQKDLPWELQLTVVYAMIWHPAAPKSL